MMIGKLVFANEGPFWGSVGEVVAKSPTGKYFVRISPSAIIAFDLWELDEVHEPHDDGEPASKKGVAVMAFIAVWFLIIVFVLL